jgi:hypothetical protein
MILLCLDHGNTSCRADISLLAETFKVDAPFESLLDDMVFDEYHIFRSTARMLPGCTPASEDK